MSDGDFPQPLPAEEPVELEMVEELEDAESSGASGTATAEFASWKVSYLNEAIPSLYLDRSLRILHANESFCGMFGCHDLTGVYFTQFFAPSFDDSRRSDLFRAVLSPATGYTWHGRVERTGVDRLLMISKVWVLPIGAGTGQPPKAYGAICLDMTDEHRHLLQSTFASLLEAARLKDNDTGNHIERVNRYARTLAMDLLDRDGAPRLDREFVESIGLVAALHDVGKIGTPDDILNKAGQLEAWEWNVMKQHTINGAYILSTYPNPMAREIALHHHERWDGSGYPHGLSEGLIPLSARIVSISDVYDALRMRRNYKEAYTHEQTVENMVAERGSHFDPYLVDRFVAIAGSFREIFGQLEDPKQA